MSDATIKWFYSYISDRHQTVIDDKGTECNWYKVSAEVPQGGALGPLLFAIFINDLLSTLLYSNHMIYANDSHVYDHSFPSNILKATVLSSFNRTLRLCLTGPPKMD